MLATPVAATLRLNFPGAKISYWSHAALRPLILGLCPSIDEFVDFDRDLGYFQQRKILKSMGPDAYSLIYPIRRAGNTSLFSPK